MSARGKAAQTFRILLTTSDFSFIMKTEILFSEGGNDMNFMNFGNLFNNLGGAAVAVFLLAVAATVLAFIFITPDKKRGKLNAFGKALHDFLNFRYLIVEKILQALYIFFTAMTVIEGVFMLFMAPYGHWMGGYGLLTMIVGPIMIRLVFELLMMVILLVKNVIAINGKLKNQNEGTTDSTNVFAAPDLSEVKETFRQKTQQNQPTETAHFCASCGSPLDADGKCPNCGK